MRLTNILFTLTTLLAVLAAAGPSGGRVLAPHHTPRFLRAHADALPLPETGKTDIPPPFRYPVNVAGGRAVELLAQEGYTVVRLWAQMPSTLRWEPHSGKAPAAPTLVVKAKKALKTFYFSLSVVQEHRTDYDNYGVKSRGVGVSFVACKVKVLPFDSDKNEVRYLEDDLESYAKYAPVGIEKKSGRIDFSVKQPMSQLVQKMTSFVTTNGLFGGGVSNGVGFVKYVITELGYNVQESDNHKFALLEAGFNSLFPNPATGYVSSGPLFTVRHV